MIELSAPLAVYRALSDLCDEEGIILGVSQTRIAEQAGLDVTLVQASLRILEHDNYVQRRPPSGRYLTSSYRISPPDSLPAPPGLRVLRGGAA